MEVQIPYSKSRAFLKLQFEDTQQIYRAVQPLPQSYFRRFSVCGQLHFTQYFVTHFLMSTRSAVASCYSIVQTRQNGPLQWCPNGFFPFLFNFVFFAAFTYISLNLSEYSYKINFCKWTFWVKATIHLKFWFILCPPPPPPGKVASIYPHTSSTWQVLFLHTLDNTELSVFFFFVNLMGEKWFLCFPLMYKKITQGNGISHTFIGFFCFFFLELLIFLSKW